MDIEDASRGFRDACSRPAPCEFIGLGRFKMLRPFRPSESDFIPKTRPPLPARLLRRILIDGNHTIGQHVLIAGVHCGETAEWLDELGFDVEAIDDSTERLSARQRS